LLWPRRRAQLLLVSEAALVQVVGSPVACAAGTRDAWRETAALVANQLEHRFGTVVRTEYFDLFDLTCPPLPPGAQLPAVLINGELFSGGGKLSVPAITARLGELLAGNDGAGG